LTSSAPVNTVRCGRSHLNHGHQFPGQLLIGGMGIAGRIIVALLVMTTVLGSLLIAIPNSSAASTPMVGGNCWDVKMEGGDFYFGSLFGGTSLKVYSYTNDTTRPIAIAGQDRTAKVGHDITFDAKGSTDNIGIVNYTWSFVAGPKTGTLHRLYGTIVHFTFEEARTYKVMLSVTDAAGNVGYDEMVVSVEKTGGISSVIGDDSVLLPFSVVLVLVAVLIIDGLARRRRKIDSPPTAQQEPPSPKA